MCGRNVLFLLPAADVACCLPTKCRKKQGLNAVFLLTSHTFLLPYCFSSLLFRNFISILSDSSPTPQTLVQQHELFVITTTNVPRFEVCSCDLWPRSEFLHRNLLLISWICATASSWNRLVNKCLRNSPI